MIVHILLATHTLQVRVSGMCSNVLVIMGYTRKVSSIRSNNTIKCTTK